MLIGILNQNETEPARLGRRTFILSAALAISSAAFWGLRRSTVASARPLGPDEGPVNVTIVRFDRDGSRTGTVIVPRLIRADDEWRRQLPPASDRKSVV